VVTTNPYDKSSVANKRRVRSVAALKSWPERRKRTFENLDSSSAKGGFVLDPPESTPAGPSRPSTAKRKRKAPRLPITPDEVAVPREADEEPLFEVCTRAFNDYCNCIHCRAERTYRFRQSDAAPGAQRGGEATALTQNRKRTADGQLKSRAPGGDMAMLTPPESPTPSPLVMVNNDGKAEPFNCYPVPYRPWFDRILHHSTDCHTLPNYLANKRQC
jgi:hypothetical protein